MHHQPPLPTTKCNKSTMTRTGTSTPNFFEEGSPFLKHPLLTAGVYHMLSLEEKGIEIASLGFGR